MGNFIQKVKEWIFTKAIKKAVTKWVIAMTTLLAVKYTPLLKSYGVTIDLDTFQMAMLGLVMGGLEFVRTTVKNRLGWTWL